MAEFDEAAFQNWYSGQAQAQGLNSDPDSPDHFYDYRAAFSAGASPDESGHWPSSFKKEGHPRMVVEGINTKTGKSVDGSVLVSELTPEQQAEIQNQAATAPAEPEGIDPVDSMDPEQLAELSVSTNGDFDPVAWATSNPDRLQDPSIEAKLADASALLRKRGFRLTDIEPKKAAGAVVDMGKGLVKWAGRALDLAIGTPIGLAASKVMGDEPKVREDYLKHQAARSGELLASTETAVTGLADLGRKAGRKAGTFAGIFKSPDEQDPEERVNDFRSAVARAQQFSKMTEGKGEATAFVTGGVLEDLEDQGYKVDPEAVQAMAMGDPVSFLALPGGFKLITGTGKNIVNVTSRAEAVALVSQLRNAQRAAQAAGRNAIAAGTPTAAITEAASAKVAQANAALQRARGAVQGSMGARANLGAAEAEALGVTALPGAVAAPIRGAQAVTGAIVEPIGKALAPVGAAISSRVAPAAQAVSAAASRVPDIALGVGAGTAGAGLRTASGIGRVVSSLLPPMVTPRALRVATEAAGRAGRSQMETAGRLIRGNQMTYSPSLRLVSDIARGAPDIAAGAAKGFLMMDIPFAAATSESPAETAHMPVFGTFFGAAGALPRVAGRVVQGQTIAPRQWGSDRAMRDYRSFSALDEANRMSVETANNPAQAQWLSAIREFIEPTGAQMYWVSDEATLGNLLRRYAPGREESWYNEAVKQRAMVATLADDAGRQQRVILLRDAEAAPHEAMHPFQDVLGAKSMEAIDRMVYEEYAPLWDDLGLNYTSRFFDSATMAEYAARGEGWQEAILDLSTGDTTWRQTVSPSQVESMANTYLAREISAELADTVLRNTGPELVQQPGILGKMARVLGKVMVGFGVEPFQGLRSEGQGIPIRMETAENFRETLRTGISDLRTEQRRGDVVNRPPYGTPREGSPVVPRTAAAPAPTPTPDSEATTRANEARDIAASELNVPAQRGMRSRQEVLSDIADAIESRGGVKIDYLSAPGEPAGSISSNRATRRAVIEAFRDMPPETRALWEKNFFPEQVVRTSAGRVQVMGWAPEVFASNAHKLARALTDAKATDLSPYKIDTATKSFTPEGWQELYRDVNTFIANQQAGATGAGQRLVVPREVTERGFRAPEETGPIPGALSQDRADVINSLFGINLPTSNRVVRYPRNLAGQAVSEATQPGRVTVPAEPRAPFAGERAEALGVAGEQIREVNPFRAELDKRKIKPSFIEAIQRLNLENIVDVAGVPEAPQFRGQEFTLQAGFQPREEGGVRFQPKTEFGKKLEEQGIEFFRAGNPGNRVLLALRNGETVGQILSARTLEDLSAANIAGIDVVPSFRRKGIAEGLYRELLTDLQADGVNKIVGHVVSEGPLRIREKVMPGETKLTDASGQPLSVDQALELLPKYDDKAHRWVMGTVKAETRIPAQARFQPSDRARYEELRGQLEGKDIEFRFGPEGQAIAREIEALKNKSGGMPPREDREPVAFQPRTAAGKKLEEQGFRLVSRQVEPARNRTDPTFSVEIQTEGGMVAAEMVYSFPEGRSEQAYVEFVEVGPRWRKQRFSETLYREVLTDLQEKGTKELGGYVLHEAPLKTRERLLPGQTRVTAAGRMMDIKDAIATSRASGGGVNVRTRIPEDAKFQPKANDDVRKVATSYTKTVKGDDFTASKQVLEVNPTVSKRIADFYESAESKPNDPEVKASYEALAKETADQYKVITDAGYTLEPYDGKGEPYKNSAEMIADVRDNKHLYFLKTESAGEFDSSNPMMADSGVNGWPVNDLFRAVHDFFGHAKEGYQFGAKGELNAWKSHSEMFSEEAQGALAAETLAQNSWVNYGKHLRDAKGEVPAKGAEGYVPPQERPFAEQKNLIVPKEMIDELLREDANFREHRKSMEGYERAEAADRADTRKRFDLIEEYRANATADLINFYGEEKWFETKKIRGRERPVLDRERLISERMGELGAWDEQTGIYSANPRNPFKFTPKKDEPRAVKSAAIRLRNGKTFEGAMHYIAREAAELALKKQIEWNDVEDGYVTNGGDFLTREEAYQRAIELKQMTPEAGVKEGLSYDQEGREGLLESESFDQVRAFQPKKDEKRQPTGWILPDRNFTALKGSLHEADLAANAKDYNKKFGTDFSATSVDEANRQPALNAGFVRIRSTPNGDTTVELNARYWSTQKEPIAEHLEAIKGRLNDVTVRLVDDKGRFVSEGADNVYMSKDKVASIQEILSDVKVPSRLVAKEPTAIQRARALPIGGGKSQFQPRREESLPGFDEIRDPLSTRALSEMNQKERRVYYPEAIVPRSAGEFIPSEITKAPLYKEAKTEEAAVEAFAKRLTAFARENEKNPAFKLGAQWYSDFTPRPNKQFGKDAGIMAELLAATSPNTNPEVNFGYAFDALKSLRAGRFDKLIPKFEEGLEKMADGSWEKWYDGELKKGTVKAPPENPSPASFMAHWIDKHKLKPTQSNGKLYGMHSVRVLQVFARRWLDLNTGPKTRNFVENLIGKSDEATIDVWADRTMRWAGYEGFADRWRILPENGTGVSDADFAFSQKAFRRAAEELKMKPSALQGALWFAEKKRWADNGWGRLDLGDFRTELEKVPLLERGFEQRLKASKLKGKKSEQLGLDIVEPR